MLRASVRLSICHFVVWTQLTWVLPPHQTPWWSACGLCGFRYLSVILPLNMEAGVAKGSFVKFLWVTAPQVGEKEMKNGQGKAWKIQSRQSSKSQLFFLFEEYCAKQCMWRLCQMAVFWLPRVLRCTFQMLSPQKLLSVWNNSMLLSSA